MRLRDLKLADAVDATSLGVGALLGKKAATQVARTVKALRSGSAAREDSDGG